MRVVNAGAYAALAAVLLINADLAVADPAAAQRLDELLIRAYGATPPLTMDASEPTPQQVVEWYGLIGDNGASGTIRKLEQEAQQLVSASGTRDALLQEMAALEAQAKTQAVTAAEGGIGGGNRGLGWYCSKVVELQKSLPQRVQGIDDVANNYRMQLRSIPVGRDDSIAQVDSLTTRFNEGIQDWKNRPETKAIDQDMRDVSAGLGKSINTYATFDGLANAAAGDARRLKVEAQQLDKLGDRFIPLIDPYLNGRNELLRELPGLQLDSPADVQKRDTLLKTLQETPPSPTSAPDWRYIIDDTVAQRSKAADDALARITTLTASIRSEATACPDKTNPANNFQALLQSTQQQIDQIEQNVISAWADRSLEIQEVDRKHAELIAQNEAQAKDLGEKIVAAEARYDAMPQDSPERQKLYENIVKAREIGAKAAQEAMDLRLARQGIQAEQQAAQRQSTAISGELRGAMSFLMQFSSN